MAPRTLNKRTGDTRENEKSRHILDLSFAHDFILRDSDMKLICKFDKEVRIQ